VRVATTRTGIKLHLIDHDKPLDHLICGVKKFGFLEIKRLKGDHICQGCVRAMFARMSRLLMPKPPKQAQSGKTGREVARQSEISNGSKGLHGGKLD